MTNVMYKSFGYGVSALTPYPGGSNHGRSCTAASEDELKESPKHVRQKKIDKLIRNFVHCVGHYAFSFPKCTVLPALKKLLKRVCFRE
jgi:hypothetical protein